MECLHCNYTGEFIGKSLICPHCIKPNNIDERKEFIRICYSCFTVNKVSCLSKARAKYCRSCSSRIRNTKDVKDLVRYRYTCETCGKERVLKAKSDAKNCKACAFESTKNKNKYERTCSICQTVETVRTLKSSKKQLCNKCQKTKRNAARYRGTGENKVKKVYSQVGTDGAKRNKVTVKLQIVDEKTMKAPVKKREPKEFPQLDRATELAMQDDWLKNNSVKVG